MRIKTMCEREEFEELKNIFQHPKKWSRYNKVFGYISFNVPEELIHAGNILPKWLFGKTDRIEKANKYIPSWCCLYSRRCLSEALNMKYKGINGIVGSKFDDTCLQLYEFLKYILNPEFSYLIDYPILKNDVSKNFFIDTLLDFKKKLDNYIRKTIEDQDLKRSISIYNTNRRLLKQLYEMRKSENPPIQGSEVLYIVISSMVMPKEEHTKRMMQFLQKLRFQKQKEEKNKETKVRVHVSGSEVYDVEIMKLIEECGALVVSDDLETGSMYFWTEVEEGKDPMEALAERYLFNKITNLESEDPFSDAITERIEYIYKFVNAFKVDGIIFLIDKGCETFGFAFPHIRQRIEKEIGIPSLHLELDVPFSGAHYASRIEAFIETLKKE